MEKTNKNVLFLVTGMTPAIITETVWALACDPQLEPDSRWVPDEIQVLSTEHGLNQVRSVLIDSQVFERFKQEFPQLAHTQFNADSLHCIKDAQNNALSDLRTPEDNEYAADAISEHIRQLTQDEQIALHVSIAGGRKTMGFYAGYALSLYGRAQDRMSHVLVDETFEQVKNFLYPTTNTVFLKDRDGHARDASKAQVWLAEIPFVRMKDAIKDDHQIHTNSFTDTVNNINAASQPITLTLNIAEQSLNLQPQEKTITLPPKEFALFCAFAQAKKQGDLGFYAPKINMDEPQQNDAKLELRQVTALSEAFMGFYQQLRDELYIEEKTIDVDKKYFDPTKSNLHKHLRKKLGLELAERLLLKQDKRAEKFYLDLDADAIVFKP